MAFESTYLSCPLLKDISYIHFSGDQQLPYVYLPLDGLPRSELSVLKHVLEIMEEIVQSKPLSLAPAAVATYPELGASHRSQQAIIVDGNHRLTAVMLMRFLAEEKLSTFPKVDWEAMLLDFCIRHRLCEKWCVVLRDGMRLLTSVAGSNYVALLSKNQDKVQNFAHISTFPALW